MATVICFFLLNGESRTLKVFLSDSSFCKILLEDKNTFGGCYEAYCCGLGNERYRKET